MSQRRCIVFAGVPEVGKSTIATNLSWRLGWPIFSTDAIRREVSQTALVPLEPDSPRYFELRDERLGQLLRGPHSFILDASMDRTWSEVKPKLREHQISYFMISFNLSRGLIERLYGIAGRSLGSLDNWMADHQRFLETYASEIGLVVTDDTYSQRIERSYEAVSRLELF